MHNQKKGARQPQRSFLPSIQDHHAWQLWGTVWREEQTQPGQSSVLQTKDDALIYPPVSASPPLAEGPSGLVSPYRGSWIFLPTMTRVSVTLSRHTTRCQFWGWSPASSWDGRPPVLGVVARQFNDMHGRRIILPRQALHRMQQRFPTNVVTL